MSSEPNRVDAVENGSPRYSPGPDESGCSWRVLPTDRHPLTRDVAAAVILLVGLVFLALVLFKLVQ